jgi:hypothetical protein
MDRGFVNPRRQPALQPGRSDVSAIRDGIPGQTGTVSDSLIDPRPGFLAAACRLLALVLGGCGAMHCGRELS